MSRDTKTISLLMKIESKNTQYGAKIAILAAFGSLLGAILVHLGAKLAIFAPLGAPLGDLGRHLGPKMLRKRLPEPLLGILLANLVAILAPKVPNGGAQTSPSFRFDRFLNRFVKES